MKTIKALEPITAYGPDKLALFAGETAEIEDSFADALIDEGKAEEYAGGGGGCGCFSFDIRSSIVDGQTVYTASATFADILAAINEGKDVVCWEIPWGNLRQKSYKDIYVNEDSDSGEVTWISFSNTRLGYNELSTATYTIQSYNNLVEFNIERKTLS